MAGLNGNGSRNHDLDKLAQLAPGTAPLLLKRSNLKCSKCGDHPPINPDGKVVALAVSIDGDDPTLHCLICYNRWQAQQIRWSVPRLELDEDAGKVPG